jgi:hypothetical protein
MESRTTPIRPLESESEVVAEPIVAGAFRAPETTSGCNGIEGINAGVCALARSATLACHKALSESQAAWTVHLLRPFAPRLTSASAKSGQRAALLRGTVVVLSQNVRITVMKLY